MCFSATASFVAGAALTATGVVTISKTTKRRELPFTSVPLFFGIQQILDGIVWVSASGALQTSAAYGYAFFAYVFWPMFIPFAILRLEPSADRKQVMRYLLGLGILVGLYGFALLVSGPLAARAINHCIRYDPFIAYWAPMYLPYVVATCGSCFASSYRAINLFGLVTFVSIAVAGWFYLETFSSVWCFFAAVLSVLVYARVHKRTPR